MFPTLGHLINYLLGTNINFPMPTYGFVLVMAFVTAGIILKFALKRKEKQGLLTGHLDNILTKAPINYPDILVSAIFYFILGYKIIGIIIDYDIFTKDINSYIFSAQGNFIAGILFALAGAGYGYLQAKKNYAPEKIYEEKNILPHELTINIVMIAMLSGIIGAKIFDILENFSRFLNDPMDALFSAGGFTFYGGLVAGFFAVWYYIRKKNINALHLMDAAAPAILGAYAVGRMACMLSGDGCWGIPNPDPKPEYLAMLPDWLWAFDFPHNVINEGSVITSCSGDYCHRLDVPVFPTPIYETILSTLFFLIVWFLQNKVRTAGIIFFVAIMLNGFARFFIEKIRVNNLYEIGNTHITQAEIISSSLVIIGILGITILLKLKKK
ncbi:MAG: prolipoprotein diacylglyceryl transferase [Bacteroidales bacterium]|nr:prolipoprotein diacylglyceryl transferase [Bacteroidales bacterium]